MLVAYDCYSVPGPYSPGAAPAGKRALRNLALAYLMENADRDAVSMCVTQFERADNMTDAMAALTALANCDCPERADALGAFYDK